MQIADMHGGLRNSIAELLLWNWFQVYVWVIFLCVLLFFHLHIHLKHRNLLLLLRCWLPILMIEVSFFPHFICIFCSRRWFFFSCRCHVFVSSVCDFVQFHSELSARVFFWWLRFSERLSGECWKSAAKRERERVKQFFFIPQLNRLRTFCLLSSCLTQKLSMSTVMLIECYFLPSLFRRFTCQSKFSVSSTWVSNCCCDRIICVFVCAVSYQL